MGNKPSVSLLLGENDPENRPRIPNTYYQDHIRMRDPYRGVRLPPVATSHPREGTGIEYAHRSIPGPHRPPRPSNHQRLTGIEYASPRASRPPLRSQIAPRHAYPTDTTPVPPAPAFVEPNSTNAPATPPVYPAVEMPVYPNDIPLHLTDGQDVNIWDIYNRKAALADADLSTGFNSSMDVLLIFAGLFSAVLTAFIIETHKLLRPDPVDLTNQLLYAMLQNQSASGVTLSPAFSPPVYAVRVNALFFASLLTSLLTALAAMLVKQWASYYDQGLRKVTSRQIKARTRQYRYDGIVRWHMPEVAALVPMVLHLSLFLFFGGIVDLLFAINKPVAFVSIALVLAGGLLYLLVNILPLASLNAPFRSPVTQLLDTVAQKFQQKHVSRRNSRLKPKDEAIEDPTDLWFGGEDPQARAVLLTRTLDVDAVVWLILETDKLTERGLLDMCFEKLMTFESIAAKNPSSFLRKEISRTYLQIASSCVHIPSMTVLPGRGPRARLLCRFLDWYLTLPHNEEQIRWMQRSIPFSDAVLPRVYARYATETNDNEAQLIARLAHRRLFHLHSAKNASCGLCLDDLVLRPQFAALDSRERQLWMQHNSNHVVQDLISITQCVFSHVIDDESRLERTLNQAISFIQADPNPAVTFEPLRRAINSGRSIYPLITARWRDRLNAAIGYSPEEYLRPMYVTRPPHPNQPARRAAV